MKTSVQIVVLSILGVFFLAGSITPALSQDEKVRAKIGMEIKSGERATSAKSRDRLEAGDLLRIYVHPEMSSYVYVVHTDQETVTLLNMVEQKIRSSTLVLPSVQEFYEVDGKAAVEAFTIICSPTELPELSILSNSEVSHEKWAAIEGELIERSRIVLTQKSERPFAIAGNVRGGLGGGSVDPFVEKLRIFSGKSHLVKRYEFSVKK